MKVKAKLVVEDKDFIFDVPTDKCNNGEACEYITLSINSSTCLKASISSLTASKGGVPIETSIFLSVYKWYIRSLGISIYCDTPFLLLNLYPITSPISFSIGFNLRGDNTCIAAIGSLVPILKPEEENSFLVISKKTLL